MSVEEHDLLWNDETIRLSARKGIARASITDKKLPDGRELSDEQVQNAQEFLDGAGG